MKKISERIKQAIRDKYAWPGGYPMFIVLSDGEALCMDCARKEYRRLAEATKDNASDGWRAVAADINYEDTECYCCHCNNKIESAYGEEA